MCFKGAFPGSGLTCCCCCCQVTSVMSDSVWPHRWQPIRLRRPWDSPGKNTGVGCHFLLQCMKVKSESEVAQLCPTLCNPMDCSLPGSSVHGIFQARVLEWGAIASSLLWFTESRILSLLLNITNEWLELKREEFKQVYNFQFWQESSCTLSLAGINPFKST